MAYSDVILATPGLLAYWRLNEASGNFVDSKFGGANAVGAGGLTRQAAGLLTGDSDKAVRGDGAAGTWITVPGQSSPGAKMTFECWVKLETYTTGRIFLGKGSTFLSQTANTTYRFNVRDTSSQDTFVVGSTNALKVGQRQHIVATYEVGSMKLYVDGVSVGGAPSPISPTLPVESGAHALNMLANSVGAAGMVGTLDEVAYYNVVLTPAQVLAHYQAASGAVDVATGSIPLSGSSVDAWHGSTSYHDAPGNSGPAFRIVLSGSAKYPRPAPITWGTSVRELPPLRHHLDAIAPNGRHYRWGKDEPNPENVPGGLRWGSTMPGGYETCDCVLPRKPGVDYADLERLSTLRVIGVGGKVVGEYRLERSPQTSGDQMAVSPSAVGWQAHLGDNKNVNIIYIDREHGGWVSANSQRRLAQLNGATDPIDSRTTQAEDGLPSLILGTQGAWTRRFNCEAYYHMPSGDAVSRIKFDYTAAASVNIGDGNWVGDIFTVTGDGHSAFSQLSPADWLAAASGSVDANASAVALASRRAAMVRVFYATGPAGSDNIQYDVFLRHPRVFGNHDLTPRGASSQTEGFYASDMIADALRKWAPMLKVAPVPPPPSPGQPHQPPFTEWIQQTSFVIPQAAFRDTTLTEIVNQLTRYGLEDWAVWNDKIFYLSPRNGSPLVRKWRARIGPAKLEATGKQVDRLWESIIVQFNDVDGTAKTVGPPGSGAEVESAYLKDSDPDNPANKLGIIRRDKLVMGASTINGAIEVGRRFLEEQKLIDRSGRATLVGHVEDNHGVLFPFSEVQAGDIITFVDAADASYRRIVKADHDDAAKSVSVDLDAPPEGLQAVLERLAVVLVPLGL